MDLKPNSKELEVAAVIEQFRREKVTGKVVLNFKQGVLVSGSKEQSL